MSQPASVPAGGVALRDSRDGDLPAIQTIYAHHVQHGLGSFEEIPPSIEEMRKRRAGILELGLPFIVAERDNRVVGYAYAALYRPRSAYRYAVEDSIYVAPEAQRLGAGRSLLAELVGRCTQLGYRQMVAVIGDSGNLGSIGVHSAAGFVEVARLRSVGVKFGRWVDSVMMQRALGAGDTSLPAEPPHHLRKKEGP